MYLVAKKVVQIFMDPTGKGLLDSPFKQLSSLSRSSTNICITLKEWSLHSVAGLLLYCSIDPAVV